jgi:cysteine-rich repeat protein
VCGDGIVECSEQCDNGSSNSDITPGACRTSCLFASCGDGLVDPDLGELCDDGNTSGCDGCDGSCLPEAGSSCGDGSLDLGQSEFCDDGNLSNGDGCSELCRPEPTSDSCGNGQALGLEICDDGNLLGGDNCNPTCNLENRATVLVGMAGQAGNIDAAASAARLGGPGALLALNEYLYYGDSANHSVRRIHIPTSTIATIAGDGSPGYADHPLGTQSRFGSIDGLASDGDTLWVSDRTNGRLRAIDLTTCNSTHCYAVTTVAGSGLSQHQDSYGPSAGFDQIGGISWHGGLIYVADEGSSTLRTVDPTTLEVRTVAGIPYTSGSVDGYGGASVLTEPRSLILTGDGTLLISDPGGNTIRRWNPTLGYMDTFSGTGGDCHVDGSAALSQIPSPAGMTTDGTSLYWAETGHHTVRQALLNNAETSTLLGSPCSMCVDPTCGSCAGCPGSHALGIGASARLSAPTDVAFHFPSNSLFVLDAGNYIILRVR